VSLSAVQAVRFVIEVAKAFGRGRCRFHDAAEREAIHERLSPTRN
jgi:hypothetical protein